MSWLDGKFLAFDLETTAKEPERARVVTATTILIDPSTGSKDVSTWLSDVDGQEIPPETTAIHGVTTERARAEGRPLHEVVAEVDKTIQRYWLQGIPVIGHNVGYDFTVLDAEIRRFWPKSAGLCMNKAVLDTYVIDKHFSYRKGSRRLVPTAAYYRVPLAESDAHDATADALAAARILWKMARAYPKLGERSLEELYDQQIVWHREQQNSLAEYYRREGIDREVAHGWPIRAATAVLS